MASSNNELDAWCGRLMTGRRLSVMINPERVGESGMTWVEGICDCEAALLNDTGGSRFLRSAHRRTTWWNSRKCRLSHHRYRASYRSSAWAGDIITTQINYKAGDLIQDHLTVTCNSLRVESMLAAFLGI